MLALCIGSNVTIDDLLKLEYSADRSTSFRRCYIKLCEHFQQVDKSTADCKNTCYRNVLTRTFKCSDHLYSSILK